MLEKNEENTVKKIRSTEQILVLAILLFTYFLETFQVAYAQKAEDLPQIVSWQDGKGELSPHKERGATSGCDRISQSNEAYLSFEGDTNTEITEENTDIEYPLCSYQAVERAIRIQISYDALKNDHPYDRRVEEILGLILDVMVSTAPKLRINREEKDIEIVKAQFAKLTKDHVEFVLQSMDDTSTKARNIRAVLLTALYNSVNTINSYYGNRYHFHLAEETRREMEETD